jgi:hypothetical protein
MKNIFTVLPESFFKPLNSQYKRDYAQCIQLIYYTFRPEISYGVNREIVVKVLSDYFEDEQTEIIFEDEDTVAKDAREKANGVIRMLKNYGWLEYEQEANHQINIVLLEYAIPIIESFNRIISNEEAEYQGIISQIHASLQNAELYRKPYELIIKGVRENTERLVSELKKLNGSIKHYIDKQMNEKDADVQQVLDDFFVYQQNIGSKAYLRMKTSDNISYFRSAITEKIDDIIAKQAIMDLAVKGYMEIEQVDLEEEAYDAVLSILRDVKSSFYRLDDIIEEIDKKHAKYMRNAVLRAKYYLSTGSNLEGKLLTILNHLSNQLNSQEESSIHELTDLQLEEKIHIYPQLFVSPESLKTIPVNKRMSEISELAGVVISEDERALYKEVMKEKNRRRFSRKNVNEYVTGLLEKNDRIKASTIPIHSRRDMLRVIYISVYGNNKANNYTIERTDHRIAVGGFTFPDFEIIKRG